MAKSTGVIVNGNIDTAKIYATHRQIKTIVDTYNKLNGDMLKITEELKENWVGSGRNEFESQYNLLISKMEDFGDALQEIYDALVEAEASYEDMDDDIRQEFRMAMQG